MHYYKKNIGDYAKKTGRLTMLQHGSYTLLIDSCYDRERFPTLEEAIDWTWASSNDEIEAVKFVLNKFFQLVDGVYVQSRIQEELAEYYAKSKKNKQIAVDRETKRTRNVHETCETVNEASPNQEPLTINQEPLTINQEKKKLSSVADATDPCPHQAIIESYHQTLPTLPRVREWTPARQTYLRNRWKEKPDRQSLDWWLGFFAYVAESDFLCGRVEGRNGKPPFQADLEWLVRPSNFVKVIEGKYENVRGAA